MRRRDFVTRVGGAALAWPVVALAQRATIPFIGFLNVGAPNERAHLVEAFRKGLREGGYVDGKDVAIEYRWAEGRADRLPALATELVNRKVAVIAATGGMVAGQAAKSTTSTIPIIFNGGGDPVQMGLVMSLAKPGGNATGIANISSSLDVKRLEILRDLLRGAVDIAYLTDLSIPSAKSRISDVQEAAKATRTKLHVVSAASEGEIDAAFTAMKQKRARALLVASNTFFITRRDQIVALAARHAIPTSYPFREFAVAGGLMSYGPDLADEYRQVGLYTARILKGAKPADLPVIQASKFELVINRAAARKLGLKVSREFLARVDEVIE